MSSVSVKAAVEMDAVQKRKGLGSSNWESSVLNSPGVPPNVK